MTAHVRSWATLLDIGAMQRTRHLDAPAHYDAIAYIFIKLIARRGAQMSTLLRS